MCSKTSVKGLHSGNYCRQRFFFNIYIFICYLQYIYLYLLSACAYKYSIYIFTSDTSTVLQVYLQIQYLHCYKSSSTCTSACYLKCFKRGRGEGFFHIQLLRKMFYSVFK